MRIRARFFEKENWGNGVFLNRAKEVIESFDKNNPANDINGIIKVFGESCRISLPLEIIRTSKQRTYSLDLQFFCKSAL